MAKLLQCHYSCSSFAVAIATCCTAKVVPMPLPQHCDTGFIKGITRKMYVGVIVTTHYCSVGAVAWYCCCCNQQVMLLLGDAVAFPLSITVAVPCCWCHHHCHPLPSPFNTIVMDLPSPLPSTIVITIKTDCWPFHYPSLMVDYHIIFKIAVGYCLCICFYHCCHWSLIIHHCQHYACCCVFFLF